MEGGGMGRTSKLTPTQWDVARELIESGDATAKETADAYGIVPNTLYSRYPGMRHVHRHAPETIKQAVHLYAVGKLSCDQVASKLEISRGSVSTIIQKHGVSRTRGFKRAPELVAAIATGRPIVDVAREFRVTLRTAYYWWYKLGDGTPRKTGRPFR